MIISLSLYFGGGTMETVNLISTLVSNLGFPIAMCIILFYSLNQERKDHRTSEEAINAAIVDLKETFTQTIHGQQEKMTEAINNNTLVMQRLIDKLDRE
jgi:chromosome condensin MukBEF complex kleisin-like MukF subunit